MSGLLSGLSADTQTEFMVNTLVAEAIKTSEIEGEFYSREDVYSSVKKNLGLVPDKQVKNAKARGISELVVSVHKTFKEHLSQASLFDWHKTLMQDRRNIKIGQWRSHTAPMQVVSGTIGKETIHFEAPPSDQVGSEMKRFIQWFNNTYPGKSEGIQNPLIRSAIAHVYFVTIHPFEDGNGRIGRAISEKALSQGTNQPLLFSLSKTIEKDKKSYYSALKQAQRTLDLNKWLKYFTTVILEAQNETEKEIFFSLKKAKFFDQYKDVLNRRQLKAIQRMFNAGINGFKGGMTAKKYMSLTSASKATATRDLQMLHENGALVRTGAGRSTRYQLNT